MPRMPDVLRFEEHRQKHRCFFKNIASLRKKHDVFHNVLGFWNSINSHGKKFGYSARNVTLDGFSMPRIYYSDFECSLCNLHLKKFIKNFGIFLIVQKTSLICIVSMMFWVFSNIVKNIEVDVFF